MRNDEAPRSDRTAAVVPPIPGEGMAAQAQDADQALVDADADFDSNELHARGKVCARCGKPIQAGEDARRTASGSYQHELCPVG